LPVASAETDAAVAVVSAEAVVVTVVATVVATVPVVATVVATVPVVTAHQEQPPPRNDRSDFP
jgi:hypothetical protein